MLRLFSSLNRWCKRHQKGIKGTLIRKMCSKVDSIVFCALLWDWSYHLLKKPFQHNPLKGIIKMLLFYCPIRIKAYHNLTWILHNMYYPNWITNYTYHNSSLIGRSFPIKIFLYIWIKISRCSGPINLEIWEILKWNTRMDVKYFISFENFSIH